MFDKNYRRIFSHLGLACVILVGVFSLQAPARGRAEADNGIPTACHFGITSPLGLDSYPVSKIGADAYLDWSAAPRPPGLPSNIAYTRVLRVRPDLYAATLANLPGYLAAEQGQVWIIGNEPDTFYQNQDSLEPEQYATSFKQLAEIIRSGDPTAKIGFGPVVQPSPLRIDYLTRVFAELDSLTLSHAASLALIDIFTPHAFILNEQDGSWGAGIPLGYPLDTPLATVFPNDLDKTHDINTFIQWVTAFRQWMKDQGAQDKPLWLTEYGSLLPPINMDGTPAYVSDATTRDYMLATFNFILGTKDANIGYSSGDEYRLVQKAYWYSLNEYRYKFGGSLFDPLTKLRTIVGDAYVAYDPVGLVTPVDPDIQPIQANVTPLRYTVGSNKTRVDYRVDIQVRNNISTDLFTNISLELFEGSTSLGLVSGKVIRCGGTSILTIYWTNAIPNIPHALRVTATVAPGSGTDTDPTNNTLTFNLTPGEPVELFLPFTSN